MAKGYNLNSREENGKDAAPEVLFEIHPVIVLVGGIVIILTMLGFSDAQLREDFDFCEDINRSLSQPENYIAEVRNTISSLKCVYDTNFSKEVESIFSVLVDRQSQEFTENSRIQRENQYVKIVHCSQTEQEDSMIVKCPGTEASPFPHEIIVPKR